MKVYRPCLSWAEKVYIADRRWSGGLNVYHLEKRSEF